MKKESKKKIIIAVFIVAVLVIVVAVGVFLNKNGKSEKVDYASLPGNASKYDYDDVEKVANNQLKDKNVYVLGSSATEGVASLDEGVAEYLEAKYECNVTKDAVKDSTMSGTEEDSYVTRIDKIKQDDIDLLVVEFTTEDLAQGKKLGTISEGIESEDYDTDTILGASEHIINYAAKNLDCEVFFYTNSRYDNEEYGKSVDELLELKNKYPRLGVANLWAEDGKIIVFNGITDEERQLYTYSDTLPTKAGYKEWWGPKIERELTSFMKKINAKGNQEQYDISLIEPMADSPLKGKTICALGSSVTYGEAAFQQAVGEYLAARFDANLVKEAVSGTTLVDEDETSYVSRMKANLDTSADYDLFVCQLSTNDASQDKELGEIVSTADMDELDTKTITGAMEYIIQYVDKNWGCPVVFYTGSRYDSEKYGAMVTRLHELENKYDNLIVLDLWTSDEFNNISEEQKELYMSDPIHPTKAGYFQWWGPEMEKQLIPNL